MPPADAARFALLELSPLDSPVFPSPAAAAGAVLPAFWLAPAAAPDVVFEEMRPLADGWAMPADCVAGDAVASTPAAPKILAPLVTVIVGTTAGELTDGLPAVDAAGDGDPPTPPLAAAATVVAVCPAFNDSLASPCCCRTAADSPDAADASTLAAEAETEYFRDVSGLPDSVDVDAGTLKGAPAAGGG